MQEINFQCSGCGQCCRSVGKLTMKDKKKLKFPYNAKEDGSCEKLLDDGKCSVYENRPDICSVEKTYNNYWKGKGRTKINVYLSENKICNKLIKQANLDQKFLIDLDYYNQFK